MNFYAALNDDGFPIAFYNLSINDNIPSDAVEITDVQWHEFIDNPGLRKWVDGAVVEYVPPPAPLPVIVVSPYQARVALLNAGLLGTFETAIDAKGGAVKIKWEYATEVRSDDADLLELATELGIAAQIPALFQAAQQVT